ncbi:MAG: hypothetical protein KKD29_03710 [Candidatus Omnitrophica bacterium]|nr:hypothetical protein [Candidatus Omnitrophota bacterium]
MWNVYDNYGWHVKIRRKLFNTNSDTKGRLAKVYDNDETVWEEYEYDGAGEIKRVTLLNPETGKNIRLEFSPLPPNDMKIYIYAEGEPLPIGFVLCPDYDDPDAVLQQFITISNKDYEGQGIAKAVKRWLALKAYRNDKKLKFAWNYNPKTAYLDSRLFKYDKNFTLRVDDWDGYRIQNVNESNIGKILLEREYYFNYEGATRRVKVINAGTGEIDKSGLPPDYDAYIKNMRLIVIDGTGEPVDLFYIPAAALYWEGSVDAARIVRDMKNDNKLRKIAGLGGQKAVKELLDFINTEADSYTIGKIAEALNSIGITSETGTALEDGVAIISQATMDKITSHVDAAGRTGLHEYTLGNGVVLLVAGATEREIAEGLAHAVNRTIFTGDYDENTQTFTGDTAAALASLSNSDYTALQALFNIPQACVNANGTMQKKHAYILDETLAKLYVYESLEEEGMAAGYIDGVGPEGLTQDEANKLTQLETILRLTYSTETYTYISTITALNSLRDRIRRTYELYISPGMLEAIAADAASEDIDWEPLIVISYNFNAKYRGDIEEFFDKYFDINNVDYYKDIFQTEASFELSMRHFITHNEETSWLETDGRDAWLHAMYDKYHQLFREGTTPVAEIKERFYKELVWILELARNINLVINYQVLQVLIETGMKDIITYKVSFTYNDDPASHSMFYNDNGVLCVNLYRYTEELRQSALSSLRFSILYQMVLRNETGYAESFPKNQAPAGTEIESRYLVGIAFNRALLRPGDAANGAKVEDLMTRLVSEWAAYELSLSGDIRAAGIKRRLQEARRRLPKQSVSDAVLEIAARAAIAEETEYPQDDEDLVWLKTWLQSDGTADDLAYFAVLKEEFKTYLSAIELKKDLKIWVLSQELFDQINPTIAGRDFYYSRAGDAYIADNGNPDEIEARKAQARMLHEYYHKLRDVPLELHTAADFFKSDPGYREAVEKTLAIMGSSDPVKRAEDVMYGENGRFDNVSLENKPEFFEFMTPEDIGVKINAYFNSPNYDGKPAVFVIKYVTGNLAMFDIFSPDSSKNFNYDTNKPEIKYTLRGFIDKYDDGTIGIFFQGHQTRDLARFMQHHGWGPVYSKQDLEEVTRNEMIYAARMFIDTGIFGPETKTYMPYRNPDGSIEWEANRSLLDLANSDLSRRYLYPPINNPDYVPQSTMSVIGEMLARYNYIKIKQLRGITLSALELELITAVENVAYLPELLEVFPLYGMDEFTADYLINLIKSQPGDTPASQAVIKAAATALNSINITGADNIYLVSLDTINKIKIALKITEDTASVFFEKGIALVSEDFSSSVNTFASSPYNETDARPTFFDVLSGRITYSMLKPDAAPYIPAIIADLETAGFRVLSQKQIINAPREVVELFYKEHKEKSFYEGLVSYIKNGIIIPLILYYDGTDMTAYDKLRSVMGDAMNPAEGTLRYKYGVQTVDIIGDDGKTYTVTKNKIHGSDSLEAVMREIGLLFNIDELNTVFSDFSAGLFDLFKASEIAKRNDSKIQIAIDVLSRASVINDLSSYLSSPNRIMRFVAAKLLGEISTPEAAQALINFISSGTETVPAVRTTVDTALKSIDVSKMSSYTYFTAGQAFFSNFEGGIYATEEYVVAGEVIIIKSGYTSIEPILAQGLAKSYFEIKKREDAVYINALKTTLVAVDVKYNDETEIKNALASIARDLYLGNDISANQPKDIFEIRLFFEDFAVFAQGNNATRDVGSQLITNLVTQTVKDLQNMDFAASLDTMRTDALWLVDNMPELKAMSDATISHVKAIVISLINLVRGEAGGGFEALYDSLSSTLGSVDKTAYFAKLSLLKQKFDAMSAQDKRNLLFSSIFHDIKKDSATRVRWHGAEGATFTAGILESRVAGTQIDITKIEDIIRYHGYMADFGTYSFPDTFTAMDQTLRDSLAIADAMDATAKTDGNRLSPMMIDALLGLTNTVTLGDYKTSNNFYTYRIDSAFCPMDHGNLSPDYISDTYGAIDTVFNGINIAERNTFTTTWQNKISVDSWVFFRTLRNSSAERFAKFIKLLSQITDKYTRENPAYSQIIFDTDIDFYALATAEREDYVNRLTGLLDTMPPTSSQAQVESELAAHGWTSVFGIPLTIQNGRIVINLLNL